MKKKTKHKDKGKDDNGNTVDMTTEEAIVVNSTDIVMKNVQTDEYSIGYISLGSLNDTVKPVDVDGVEATAENIKEGSYSVARPFNIATKGEVSELANDFISFILSEQGQEIASGSYIPIDTDYSYEPSGLTGKIVIAGSTSVAPLMEKLAEAYEELNEGVEIEIQANGSSAGINAVIDGTAEIGMASRELKDAEKEQVDGTVIALDGIAVIVNPENPTDDLSPEEITGIYTGEITSWDEVN